MLTEVANIKVAEMLAALPARVDKHGVDAAISLIAVKLNDLINAKLMDMDDAQNVCLSAAMIAVAHETR